MPDPITVTIGAAVAAALAEGAKALAVGVLTPAAKDAYGALKSYVARWAGGDVAALEEQAQEARPTGTREAVLAEALDNRPAADLTDASAFTSALIRALRDQAAAAGPVGIDIGRLEALEVDLGRMTVTAGTGFRAGEVRTDTFRAEGLEIGPGKP